MDIFHQLFDTFVTRCRTLGDGDRSLDLEINLIHPYVQDDTGVQDTIGGRNPAFCPDLLGMGRSQDVHPAGTVEVDAAANAPGLQMGRSVDEDALTGVVGAPIGRIGFQRVDPAHQIDTASRPHFCTDTDLVVRPNRDRRSPSMVEDIPAHVGPTGIPVGHYLTPGQDQALVIRIISGIDLDRAIGPLGNDLACGMYQHTRARGISTANNLYMIIGIDVAACFNRIAGKIEGMAADISLSKGLDQDIRRLSGPVEGLAQEIPLLIPVQGDVRSRHHIPHDLQVRLSVDADMSTAAVRGQTGRIDPSRCIDHDAETLVGRPRHAAVDLGGL